VKENMLIADFSSKNYKENIFWSYTAHAPGTSQVEPFYIKIIWINRIDHPH
jgi:hypothetical protein